MNVQVPTDGTSDGDLGRTKKLRATTHDAHERIDLKLPVPTPTTAPSFEEIIDLPAALGWLYVAEGLRRTEQPDFGFGVRSRKFGPPQ